MKDIKTFMVMAIAALIVAPALTSCFNDDDNNDNNTLNYMKLTDAQQRMVMEEFDGRYETKVYFTNADTQKTDSAEVNWVMNSEDSTATCTNFPVNILRNYVTSDKVKAVLDKVGAQPVTFKYICDAVVVKEYFEAQNFFYYLTAPNNNTATFSYEKEDGEGEGTLTIEFANQFTGYSVVYTQMAMLNKGKLSGGLLVANVKVDGLTTATNSIIPFQ